MVELFSDGRWPDWAALGLPGQRAFLAWVCPSVASCCPHPPAHAAHPPLSAPSLAESSAHPTLAARLPNLSSQMPTPPLPGHHHSPTPPTNDVPVKLCVRCVTIGVNPVYFQMTWGFGCLA